MPAQDDGIIPQMRPALSLASAAHSDLPGGTEDKGKAYANNQRYKFRYRAGRSSQIAARNCQRWIHLPSQWLPEYLHGLPSAAR